MREDQQASQWGNAGVSAATAIGDATLNPAAKEPDAAKLAELQGLLTKYSDQDAQLMREDRLLCREALLTAVANGQYLSKTRPVVAEVDPARLAFALRRDQEQQKRDQQEGEKELATRLGTLMQDWAYSQCSTIEPDGVPRTTLVYYTRAQAPDVFAGRARMSELAHERRRVLRQFFDDLP